jgi:peptidoglycan/xylan/chitin deacetylase (PgdA/CDA1 family)
VTAIAAPAPASRLVRRFATPNPNTLERLYSWWGLASRGLPGYLLRRSFDPATTIPVFAQHAPRVEYLEPKLRYLAENGYDTITVAEYEQWLAGAWTPTRPTVMLTFDDGMREFGERVVPLLRRYGCRAVLFVCPGLVDLASRPEDSIGTIVRRQFLDWQELLELAGSGTVDLQSHGLWHNRVPVSRSREAAIRGPVTSIRSVLDTMPPEGALRDLVEGRVHELERYPSVPLYLSDAYETIAADACEARRSLEERLRRPVTAFAFPWWNGSAVAVQALRQAGYRSIFWGMRGTFHGPTADRIGRLSFDWIHCLPGSGRLSVPELLVQKARGLQRD